MRSMNCGRTGLTSNGRSYQEEELEEARRAVVQERKAVEQEEEDLGMLCKGIIRKVMCLRL